MTVVGFLEGTVTITAGLRPAGCNRDALDVVNRRVSAAFGKPPKALVVEFFHLPPMAEQYYRSKGAFLNGCTSPTKGEPVPVILYLRAGWQSTFIHELTHVYNPETTERQVRKLTRIASEYLRNSERVRQENLRLEAVSA